MYYQPQIPDFFNNALVVICIKDYVEAKIYMNIDTFLRDPPALMMSRVIYVNTNYQTTMANFTNDDEPRSMLEDMGSVAYFIRTDSRKPNMHFSLYN